MPAAATASLLQAWAVLERAAGDVSLARQLFKCAVKADPKSEPSWLVRPRSPPCCLLPAPAEEAGPRVGAGLPPTPVAAGVDAPRSHAGSRPALPEASSGPLSPSRRPSAPVPSTSNRLAAQAAPHPPTFLLACCPPVSLCNIRRAPPAVRAGVPCHAGGPHPPVPAPAPHSQPLPLLLLLPTNPCNSYSQPTPATPTPNQPLLQLTPTQPTPTTPTPNQPLLLLLPTNPSYNLLPPN